MCLFNDLKLPKHFGCVFYAFLSKTNLKKMLLFSFFTPIKPCSVPYLFHKKFTFIFQLTEYTRLMSTHYCLVFFFLKKSLFFYHFFQIYLLYSKLSILLRSEQFSGPTRIDWNSLETSTNKISKTLLAMDKTFGERISV